MSLLKLVRSCSDVVSSWPLGSLGLGSLGSDSGAGLCHMVPVTGLRKLIWIYKAIHSLWLPLLGLGMSGKDQLCT